MVRVEHWREWRIEEFGLDERARFVWIYVWRQRFPGKLSIEVEAVLDFWLAI